MRDQDIEQALGYDKLKKIKNKHIGGCNNAKGNHYEKWFAVYKTAELAVVFLNSGSDSKIAAQVLAPVDDLEIEYSSGELHSFQLKNASEISIKDVLNDFYNQNKLNNHGNKNGKIFLVSPCQNVCISFNSRIPLDFSTIFSAINFSNGQIEHLLKVELNFLSAIKRLCAIEDEEDKLLSTALALSGAWDKNHTPGVQRNVYEILKSAKDIQFSFLCAIEKCPGLSPELESILKNIPNLTYSIEKGFFRWSYLSGLESGILAYDCADKRFEKFQKRIIKNNPKSWDELEDMLS